ncbi:hypothetical protein [Chromobacterium haemolyticum]|uniref:hypothetical protein n=1 Tax=Chromobacterium haemolyticum TaxID=394935 RepID=UPI0012FC1EFB|nr:hypothetical protein [Chromobacterium haemolyticum]
MCYKCLSSTAMNHIGQMQTNALQQLEARREDFYLVEGIATKLVAVGVEAVASFHLPATPYLQVKGLIDNGIESQLRSISEQLGHIVAWIGGKGWLLLASGSGRPKLAIEVTAL